MVEYAKVAQAAGAAMFCVGTEMESMTDPTKSFSIRRRNKTYTQQWGEIIAAVRAVYSGKVTYAATYVETAKVGFWDKVDYIGVDAYLPLTSKHQPSDTSPYGPTVDEMVDAWIKPHFNPWVRDTLHGASPPSITTSPCRSSTASRSSSPRSAIAARMATTRIRAISVAATDPTTCRSRSTLTPRSTR